MEKGTRNIVKGISAGSVMAGAPLAASVIGNLIPKGIEKGDFLKIKDSRLITKGGCEVLLQGINLVEAPFTALKDGKYFSDNRFEIFTALEERFGNYGARDVFNRCFSSFVTAGDIKSIAKTGFNCVVIPLRCDLLVSEKKKKAVTFKKLDAIIKACRKAGVYAILSLDAAAGCKENNNNLFGEGKECASNRSETIKFWAKMAKSYKDEPVVAAYNIIGSLEAENKEAVDDLCKKIIKAIRKEKDNHIIIAETSSDEILALGNVAMGISGAYTAICDVDAVTEKAVKVKENGNAVIALNFFPADYEKACTDLGNADISWAVGRYKGDMFCLYSGEKQSIDLSTDNYDTINEKLSAPLDTKNYTLNKGMSEMFGRVIDNSKKLTKEPQPVKINYAGGSAMSAGM